MEFERTPLRYNFIAIIFHWVMAIGFFIMLAVGLYMVHFDEDKFSQFQWYQWHKSLGVLLLLAVIPRFIIRLTTAKPKLPESLNKLEKFLSKLVHRALYLWMFILPVSGWIMVSASVFAIPTIVFGWFEWPHFPYIETNAELEEVAKFMHQWLAYAFILFIGMHIAAVIKHWLFEGINLLPRIGIGRVSKEK